MAATPKKGVFSYAVVVNQSHKTFTVAFSRLQGCPPFSGLYIHFICHPSTEDATYCFRQKASSLTKRAVHFSSLRERTLPAEHQDKNKLHVFSFLILISCVLTARGAHLWQFSPTERLQCWHSNGEEAHEEMNFLYIFVSSQKNTVVFVICLV